MTAFGSHVIPRRRAGRRLLFAAGGGRSADSAEHERARGAVAAQLPPASGGRPSPGGHVGRDVPHSHPPRPTAVAPGPPAYCRVREAPAF